MEGGSSGQKVKLNCFKLLLTFNRSNIGAKEVSVTIVHLINEGHDQLSKT
jgi:hypothetical protein